MVWRSHDLIMAEKRKPELLAPAGSFQALRAAVENGADAVYLGGKSYGARAYAENFTREELLEALKYTHVRGIKTYVTVNTLIDNREFGDLTDFLLFLYREGTDGLIVQDLGVVKLIKEILPDFPLHGSTQMTVHNAAGAVFLNELGFKRVVLARETTFEDLLAIRRKVTLELEIFVHGALCFCYSGQCLFSSMVGGRSGNRGCCAQPCRLTYTLVNKKGEVLNKKYADKHLLSPKDLMLLKELPVLINAGIDSLKIEGRMKRPEYVATVTRIYRQALDRAFNDPENYFVNEEEIDQLKQIFNREFSTGYFYGNPGRDLIGYSRPNNRGLYAGRVVNVKPKGMVEIQTDVSLKLGDGIEFWTSKGGRKGLTIRKLFENRVPVQEVKPGARAETEVPFQVNPGDRIFKTHDVKLIQIAKKSYTGPLQRKIPISIKAYIKHGKPLKLEAWDIDGFNVSVQGSFPCERAIKHKVTPDLLLNQISRLGNTPFVLKQFECETDHDVMLPISEINSVRRALTVALEEARINKFKRTITDITNNIEQFWLALNDKVKRNRKNSSETCLAVAVSDYESLKAALVGGAQVVYFGGTAYRGKTPWDLYNLAKGIELCRKYNAKAYCIVPRIWHEREHDEIEKLIESAQELNADGVMVGDIGGLKLALDAGMDVVSDFSIHVFNDLAVSLLIEIGVKRLTLSPELNREQLNNFNCKAEHLELLIHGAIPLMISEHCVLGALSTEKKSCTKLCLNELYFLKDRRGYLFPLLQDEHCRMSLYNARELCLIEHIGNIMEKGYGAIRLELRYHDASMVRKITEIYRRAYDLFKNGLWNKEKAEEAWNTLFELSPLGLTRGHYLRGVINDDEAGGESGG